VSRRDASQGTMSATFSANKKNIRGKIQYNYGHFEDQYNSGCQSGEDTLYEDGDVWYGGLRSSLANGIYEQWIDNIGGPMISASRRKVQEAASRYYKDIDPTELRYRDYRVNPQSKTTTSTAITPVKHYIYDWYEDPKLYIGIVAALLSFLKGSPSSDYDYQYTFIDKGVLDYDKLFRPIQGNII